jgi:hypothetical protein
MAARDVALAEEWSAMTSLTPTAFTSRAVQAIGSEQPRAQVYAYHVGLFMAIYEVRVPQRVTTFMIPVAKSELRREPSKTRVPSCRFRLSTEPVHHPRNVDRRADGGILQRRFGKSLIACLAKYVERGGGKKPHT